MGRVWSIQYLRGAAALAVVVFHALNSSHYRFEVGAAGVDVFFVISGFIMASLMLDDDARPGAFFTRRLIRIVPLYWLSTAAVIGVFWLKRDLIANVDPSASNTLLSLAFIPHSSSAGTAPVLWLGWTLEYEMFFYVLCTFALLLPAANRLQSLVALLLLLSAVGVTVHPEHPIARVYTSPLLLEFAAGIGLAVAWRARTLPNSLIGLASLVAGLVWFTALEVGVLSRIGVRAFDWGVPAFLIVAGALSLEAHNRVIHSRFGLLLGDASYSLYLTHVFVVALFLWFFSDVSLWIRVPACVAGSIALAIASHLWVEKPLLNAMRPGRRKQPGSTESMQTASP